MTAPPPQPQEPTQSSSRITSFIILIIWTKDKIDDKQLQELILFIFAAPKPTYHLNRGFNCIPDYVPITNSWQHCKNASESLGFTGDDVAHVDYKNEAWDGSRPKGCFRAKGRRFHFNEGAGGAAQENDHILCIHKYLGT